MWRAAATVGVWTMASRLLGFARDILIAATLGAGPVADAFFVALKLPNLFRRLFGEGAFNAAFVPAFTSTATTTGLPAARRLASNVASVMALALGLLTLLGEIFMPWLMRGFAPGFWVTPDRFHLAVTLTRITFPYLALICLTALLSGVLNGIDRFAVAAATPVLFNLICIAALLGLSRYLPTAGHALAIGVLLAGIAQFLWLATACHRAGAGLTLVPPRLTAGVRHILARMGPGLVGAGVTQLNLTVGVIIASLLPAGTVSILYYADRVNQLPLGVIGAAVGTALLPALTRDLHHADPTRAATRLNRAIEMALSLVLPATIALLVLASPIMQVLFGRGAFTPDAVARSALVLAIYAASLPATVLAKLFAPACFARGDTTTPVITGLLAVLLNLTLSLLLMHRLGFLAPALATTIAATANTALLGAILWRRGALRPDPALRRRTPRVGLAALLMGLSLWLLAKPFMPLFLPHGIRRWLLLAMLVGTGLAVFALAGQVLGGFDVRKWKGQGSALDPYGPRPL